MERVLAVLPSAAAAVGGVEETTNASAGPAGVVGEKNPGNAVVDNSKNGSHGGGSEASSEGDPDGVKHLAVDADSS